MAGAIPAAVLASRETAGFIRSIAEAMNKPLYSDLDVTTTTRVNKKGVVVSHTKTKGYTISHGMVYMAIGGVVVWEVGQSFAKALGGKFGVVVKDSAEFLASPVLFAFTVEGTMVAAGINQLAADGTGVVQTFWNWLDGSGTRSSSPPPSTSKVIAMPPTGMAALDSIFQNGLGAIATPMATAIPNLLNKLAGLDLGSAFQGLTGQATGSAQGTNPQTKAGPAVPPGQPGKG